MSADYYVEGDVNTLDESFVNDAPDEVAPTAEAALVYLARALADSPDAVSVDVQQRGGKVVLSLSVDKDDMGRLIGRRGRTAQALRSLVAAAGARDGVTTSVDILD